MLENPSFNTDATDALCTEIAKKSRGVCFLGVSGKDSLCSWLQLRRYFKRIIPFNCSAVPGMSFNERKLEYYEEEFDRRIIRMLDGSIWHSLYGMVYQTLQGVFDLGVNTDFYEFGKLDVVDTLRREFGLPKAWCAFGINASDSIDRHIYVMKVEGRNDGNRTFYPCYDWSRNDIMKSLEDSGLKLPSEYKYSRFSMPAMPCATYNRILREHYPADYERLLSLFPLMEAKTVREEMLTEAAKARLGDGAAADGGGTDDGGDDGSPFDDALQTADEFAEVRDETAVTSRVQNAEP